jgi:hypothetical protein
MEGEWPEFSIPSVDEAGGSAPAASTPGGSGGPAPTTPGQTAPAGTPQQTQPSTTDENIPKYRYDQLNTRTQELERNFQQMQEMNTRLTDALARAMEAARPAAPNEPALDPEEAQRRENIRKQLQEIYPELGDLNSVRDIIKLKDKLEAVVAQSEQNASRDAERFDDYAKRSISALHNEFAAVFGKGKTAADLNDDQRREIAKSFVDWIGADPTRIRRYDMGDNAALRGEFIKAWTDRWVEPLRRTGAAQTMRQARTTERLPVGGSASSPLGTPAPKPSTQKDDDDEAIFRRGWEVAQNILSAER